MGIIAQIRVISEIRGKNQSLLSRMTLRPWRRPALPSCSRRCTAHQLDLDAAGQARRQVVRHHHYPTQHAYQHSAQQTERDNCTDHRERGDGLPTPQHIQDRIKPQKLCHIYPLSLPQD